MASLFQSTLSLRRATSALSAMSISPFYFNPRSPCGERRDVLNAIFISLTVFQSTLSLRRATAFPFSAARRSLFQSTLSLRRATL